MTNLSRRPRIHLIIATLFMLISINSATHAQENSQERAPLNHCNCRDVLSPTQAANAFWAELYGADTAKQVDIVSKYLALITLDSEQMPESRLDRLALGEGAFLTFNVGEAHAFFSNLLDGDNDLITQHAWNRAMQIRFRALEQFDVTESMMAEYYEKFPPSMENISGRYQQVSNFASKYLAEGNIEAVAELIESELKAIPDNLPHFSYGLMGRFGSIVSQSSRAEAIQDLLASRVPALRAQANNWKENPQPAGEDPILKQTMPDWYWRTQRVNPGESLQDARLRQLTGLLDYMENNTVD